MSGKRYRTVHITDGPRKEEWRYSIRGDTVRLYSPGVRNVNQATEVKVWDVLEMTFTQWADAAYQKRIASHPMPGVTPEKVKQYIEKHVKEKNDA